MIVSTAHRLACCVSLLALGLLLGAGPVLAQTATVRGFVQDAADGQPLQGVNVTLRDGGGGLYGSATDADGFFAVSGLPPGRYTLRGTFIGYQTYETTLDLSADELRTLSFEMRFGEEALDEVIIETEREAVGAASVTAGLQTIRAEDIELVPAPDVSGDLAQYLGTLPGVVSTGDQGGQLFIRGGEPTQNLVLLDGAVLFQPFHLIGFYSAFPSDIINSTDVYAGGFGARYGGRLSSVIDINTRNGNKRRLAGSVSVAPFVSGARLEGPIVRDRVSFLLSGRTSVIEQGAEQLIDEPLPYTFDDQFAKVHAELSENSQASITGIRTYDRGVLGDAGAASDQVLWNNRALSARYLLLPRTLPVLAEVLLSYSSVDNSVGPEDAPTRSSSTEQYRVGANVTHFLRTMDLDWGLYLSTSQLDSDLRGQFQEVDSEVEFLTEAGAYVEPEFRVGRGLRIRPGVRVQTFPSKGRTFIEPRLRTTWQVGAHRLSGAVGLYHQEVVGLSDRRDAGDIFTTWTSSPLEEVPQAVHGIVGYQVEPTGGLELSVEGFYKALTNLSVAEWTAFPRFTTTLQPADGRAYGVDLRVEVQRGAFYGFVNYGYSQVEYDAQQETIQFWFGTLEETYTPPHDRRHQVNALGTLDLYGVDLNVRWQYGSGLPFSEALGFDEFVLLAGPTDVTQAPGETRIVYGRPYNRRLPAYHRLDVSMERAFALAARTEATLQIGLVNTYDRSNPFYIDLFTLRQLDQLPLIPSVGFKLAFN